MAIYTFLRRIPLFVHAVFVLDPNLLLDHLASYRPQTAYNSIESHVYGFIGATDDLSVTRPSLFNPRNGSLSRLHILPIERAQSAAREPHHNTRSIALFLTASSSIHSPPEMRWYRDEILNPGLGHSGFWHRYSDTLKHHNTPRCNE